jgi:pyruvate ferredoxin oxidoreductase delta subunit
MTKNTLSDKEMKEWIDKKWGYEKLPMGGSVPYPGSSKFFKTGDWSAFKAVVDRKKCTKCTTCFFLCPDSAITMDKEDIPVMDFDYCKGCGICAEECPADAIEMKDLTK